MRFALYVLAGLGVWCPGAQAQGLYLGGGAGQRTVDLNVTGTLSGALNPSAPTSFVFDESADGAVFAVTLGHDWMFGPWALGLSAEGSFAGIDEDFDPITANSSVTQTTQF